MPRTKRKAVRPTAESISIVAKAMHNAYNKRNGGVGGKDAYGRNIDAYEKLMSIAIGNYEAAARAAIAAWERVRGGKKRGK